MNNKRFKVKLKIGWFKDTLGLAIDQVGLNQSYSLTPYYFWPKTEAWEQLKLELDSKLWLSKKEKVTILENVRKIMSYWLLNRDIKTADELNDIFNDIEVLSTHY